MNLMEHRIRNMYIVLDVYFNYYLYLFYMSDYKSDMGAINFTKNEKENMNNDLNKGGISIWCKRDTGIEQNLKEVLKNHYKKRTQALNLLMNPMLDFINKFYYYFNIDDDCLCDGLINESDAYNLVFKVIKKGPAGKAGQTYFMDDDRIIMKKILNVEHKKYLSLRIEKQYIDEYGDLNISNNFNKFKIKNTNEYRNISVYSDNFTNQTIIHMILNIMLKNNPNYIYQHDAFFCGNDGYNIMEYANGGDLSNYLTNLSRQRNGVMNTELATNILVDVLTPLKILKHEKFGFNHSDLKCRNVFVHIEDGQPIFKIADYDKSSIYWNGIRFYNNGVSLKADLEILKTYGIKYKLPNINLVKWLPGQYVPYKLDNKGFYNLGAGTLSYPLQIYTMHTQYGFYLSYDVYTFMWSLMMEPIFYMYILRQYYDKYEIYDTNMVFNENERVVRDEIYEIWENLWDKEVYKGVKTEDEERIYGDDMINYDRVMSIIRVEHEKLEDNKSHIDKMRSLSYMNSIFQLNGLRFRHNVDFVYNKLGLGNLKPDDELLGRNNIELKLSNKNKICLDECTVKNKKCTTNKYSSTGIWGTTRVFDWDDCTP